MSDQFHPKNISKHLYLTMFVIIIAVLLISVSMIVDNYHKYKLSETTLNEIRSLKMIAELAHLISRERAPANNLMSSSIEELPHYRSELKNYRQKVNDYLTATQKQLQATGFDDVARCLNEEVKTALQQGREKVDQYSAIPPSARTLQQMDQAILAMYNAWDSNYIALKHLIKNSQGRDANSSGDYYILILILADLRDQAGRVASNIIPAIAFNQPIPQENLGRSLQTQRQTYSLWKMIDVIQPEKRKSPRFNHLYQNVDEKFLRQGVPLVQQLINDSLANRPYSFSAVDLTTQIGPHFLSVVDLQNYLLEESMRVVESEKQQAQNALWFAIIVTLIGLVAILIAMVYTKQHVFNPLIRARLLMLDLILKNQHKFGRNSESSTNSQHLSLLQSIEHLKIMLKERDDFEFKLKNIANSDAMTGVGNRLALEEYIKYRHQQPNQFADSCLLVIDIDYFKQVNDVFGHLIGDEVIKHVAKTLKKYLRSSDFIVRYGGDEFLVLIQNVATTKALVVADKLRFEINRNKIKTSELGLDKTITISVSIGVAGGYHQWEDLMKTADQALLAAKAKGRNCVAIG